MNLFGRDTLRDYAVFIGVLVLGMSAVYITWANIPVDELRRLTPQQWDKLADVVIALDSK